MPALPLYDMYELNLAYADAGDRRRLVDDWIVQDEAQRYIPASLGSLCAILSVLAMLQAMLVVALIRLSTAMDASFWHIFCRQCFYQWPY